MSNAVVWVHVGDLHPDGADGWMARGRPAAIVAAVNERIASTAVVQAQPPQLVTDALLIGADLGPNVSITGALATILMADRDPPGGRRCRLSRFPQGRGSGDAACVGCGNGCPIAAWLT